MPPPEINVAYCESAGFRLIKVDEVQKHSILEERRLARREAVAGAP